MIDNILDKNQFAYKIRVKTTNGIGDTTRALDGQCLSAKEGIVIVITSEPGRIFDTFSVESIEKIGPGYCFAGCAAGRKTV